MVDMQIVDEIEKSYQENVNETSSNNILKMVEQNKCKQLNKTNVNG